MEIDRIQIILVDAPFRRLVAMRKAILHLKKADPVLSSLIERVGRYGIQYREPNFETLVRSIVYQQLSGQVATVIFGRLSALAPGGQLTPEAILKLTPARMRKAGLSKQKTAYIRDLARKTAHGELKFDTLAEMADHEVIEHLTQVKGIGVWTAHMFLLFALQRPDVLPTGDLGIRMAIRKAYGLDELPHPKHIEEIALRWCPYCSVATWYLWRSLDGQADI
jgi:DNA-3-methyladenine glycosylase II